MMYCSGPGATHYSGCECWEKARNEKVAALQRVVDAARAVARKRQYPEARLAALSKLRAALAALDKAKP